MKRTAAIVAICIFVTACTGCEAGRKNEGAAAKTVAPAGAVTVATGIVTEIIVKPDPEGDPWEREKVAGFNGDDFVNDIFDMIYNGTLTPYDYHSGEKMTPEQVRELEKEFSGDRSKIGKLSFTEDWYYVPSANRLEKKTRSVVFGYELYNNLGKVYAYRAAFRVDLGE